ncbi:LysR substrate-binding domain-containing protein [Solicola sp. PLA-1-18]|uniref:LysR substrate-binding domain-containing protein n=1 Tax=Solicola sp. PLA-1-18 TaxID=3380532 RepID=UPI003B7845B9
MSHMFDLGRMRVLRELSHRGTLAAVAEALSYSPSTISQQLSQLEKETGTRLLEPDGRKVRLTAQAHVLVAHTEKVLAVMDETQAAMAASPHGIQGHLRVAAFQTVASALLPQVVERIHDEEPALRVSVTQMEPEHALPALRARDFDLVFTEDYPGTPSPRPPGLDVEHLTDDPLRLYALAEQVGDVADLAETVWVMEPHGSAARHWAVAQCREAGFEPDVRFESTDLRFHAELVRHGQAAAFLPDLAGPHLTDDLTPLPLPHSPARRLSTVTRTGHRDHPAITLLRQRVHDAANAPTNRGHRDHEAIARTRPT